jgi:hypothetical protein
MSNHVIANGELVGVREESSCGIFWELFDICIARWWKTIMQIQPGYSLIILLCFWISIWNMCVWTYWYTQKKSKKIWIFTRRKNRKKKLQANFTPLLIYKLEMPERISIISGHITTWHRIIDRGQCEYQQTDWSWEKIFKMCGRK